MEHIILVDEQDNDIGTMEKMQAHKEGRLHRAFSVFVFNSRGELLLQQRAKHKYHCGGLWTNTCCSHQRKEETTLAAAHRRLKEEMGFDTDLKELFSFIYTAEFPNGLTEHEIDHVLVGEYDGMPDSDREEVEDWKWISLEDLRKDIEANPDSYTYWFKVALPRVIAEQQSQ